MNNLNWAEAFAIVGSVWAIPLSMLAYYFILTEKTHFKRVNHAMGDCKICHLKENE